MTGCVYNFNCSAGTVGKMVEQEKKIQPSQLDIFSRDKEKDLLCCRPVCFAHGNLAECMAS